MYDMTLLERLTNLPKILLFYFSKFFIPIKIGGIHIWTVEKITWQSFFYPLMIDLFIALFIGIMGVFIFKKSKKHFFSFLFFLSFLLAGLLMVSHIIPLDYTVAGRWFSFPMVGLLGICGVFFNSIHLNKKMAKLALFFTLLFLFYLSFFTIERNSKFKDNITLFTRWMENDDNYAIRNLLSNAYFNDGDFDNALYHADMSILMYRFDNNLSLRALILEKMGLKDESVSTAVEAMNTDNYAPYTHGEQIYSELLGVFVRNGEYKQAEKLMDQALKDYPYNDYFRSVNEQIKKQLEEEG